MSEITFKNILEENEKLGGEIRCLEFFGIKEHQYFSDSFVVQCDLTRAHQIQFAQIGGVHLQVEGDGLLCMAVSPEWHDDEWKARDIAEKFYNKAKRIKRKKENQWSDHRR